jgi:esterase/lipase superfamily enzyme
MTIGAILNAPRYTYRKAKKKKRAKARDTTPAHPDGRAKSSLEGGAGEVYPVWFGTDRKPIDQKNLTAGFTNCHHDQVSLGRVDVLVPTAHRFGETGSSFWARFRRFDFRNDTLSVERVLPLTANELWDELQQETDAVRVGGGSPHALLYLHGYNTSFHEAAIRAAQIGFDLKIPGPTAFFSWPSQGTMIGYPADEASIEASEAAITNFILNFHRHSEADKIHIIAHSMGNRGLLRSLHRIIADAETRAAVRFGQIFLAAPDVDRRLFLDLAHVYPAVSDRTTLYSSSRDFAVYLSARFHIADRAGYYLPHTVTEGIDSVAVPGFNVDLLGHGYFAKAEALLHDMHDLIRHNTPPRLRQRVEPLAYKDESLWQIRR